MPKLTKAHANKAATAAKDWGDGFEPLKPGRYLARLVSVTPKDGQKAPYWEWKFEVLGQRNTLFENTSLSENAIGRLGKMFEAFGVPADTDTDELIGEVVCLIVGTRTQTVGERAGQLQNTINGALPPQEHPDYDGSAAAPVGGTASSDDYGSDEPADTGSAGPSIDWEAIGEAANENEEGWEAAMLLALGAHLGLDDSQYDWNEFATVIGEAVDADPNDEVVGIIGEHMPAPEVGDEFGDEEPF